ncbi:MAG: hypothetical protein AVDCRST_MAG66-4296 [uncultured Pseudonocardia sp.]|uniref:Carrier domain-containing protein n=1 Tax=uncultured Pseudonocardia sp. TaxID=211455 RepID=A0A6J4QK66_9PSEU|nr:MAG: hypothetical protein AVDCRST_MAG66-4296 [uncultured Pseudonocardia sp.]
MTGSPHRPAVAPDVVDRFSARARTSPDDVAVVDGAASVTYGELAAASAAVAAALAAEGLAAEDVVPVVLGRGTALIATLLGVLEAGAAFACLDPATPRARFDMLLADSGARLVLTDAAGTTTLTPCAVPTLDVSTLLRGGGDRVGGAAPAERGSLAYLLYTSGSTGRPKPVAVGRTALSHHAEAVARALALTPRDRVLQFAGPGFDVLLEEVFPTLSAGGAVVVAPTPVPPPAELEALLASAGVTIVNVPTPYWEEWVADLVRRPRPLPPALRLAVIGSDRGLGVTLRRWAERTDVPVVNAYGLTETTITSTLQFFAPAEPVDDGPLPIGLPLDGTEVHLLDGHGAAVADGAVGELYIGGPQVALGYHGMPLETEARFVPDTTTGRAGARLFRTGDLAQRRPDGALQLLGRVYDQVKIRGQRVEPGEVTAALLAHPGVHRAHTRVVGDGTSRGLLGYVVLSDAAVTEAELRTHLAETLPAVMVPARVVALPEIPLTPNGKVDGAALPDPPAAPTSGTAARTDLEALVASVWQDVLDLPSVGLDDSFFDVGGHSVLLVRVQSLLSGQLGRAVPGVALFEHYTVRRLARYLEGTTDDDGGSTDAGVAVPVGSAGPALRGPRGGRRRRAAAAAVDGSAGAHDDHV